MIVKNFATVLTTIVSTNDQEPGAWTPGLAINDSMYLYPEDTLILRFNVDYKDQIRTLVLQCKLTNADD